MLSRHSITALDRQNVLSSVEVLDKQCEEAWHGVAQLDVPTSFRDVDRIVLFGMGGSALGMHVVQTLFADQLRVPVVIVNDYAIPGFVNERTLVLLSSYSGATEEVTAVSRDILAKTQKVIVVTTGGALAAFAKEKNVPAYIFSPTFNPSNQPRMALGYGVMAIVGLFTKLGFVSITEEEATSVWTTIASLHASFGPDNDTENRAKDLAQKLHGRVPVLISSEFLEGAAHVFANQINENAKQFCVRFSLPELDHHWIEGLTHPAEFLRHCTAVFFTSILIHPRNQRRYTITQEITKHQGLGVVVAPLQSRTRVTQTFELLLLGSYISLYLAILNNLDPSPIPNVDYLKKKLLDFSK